LIKIEKNFTELMLPEEFGDHIGPKCGIILAGNLFIRIIFKVT
jgi:hypothetical protein